MENSKIRWDDPKPEFKWPVTATRAIQVPAEKVWQAISTPGNLENCHPFCLKNPVQEWSGETSRDQVHYLSGWIYERQFLRWIEGIGYDLKIGRAGGRTSYVSWRIQPTSDESCVLRIVVYPFLLQHLPVGVRWIPHFTYVGPLLSKYLSSVVRGFEWFVTKGESVPRNQFGRHPWFSG